MYINHEKPDEMVLNDEMNIVVEEQMGLEYDENDEDSLPDEEQPFNAESIRIDQQMLSLQYVYELYKDGSLKLNPGFQRKYVWGRTKRALSLLIESLMLRIPIPAFYFYENNDASFFVIDGRQRLTTAFDFIDNKFPLQKLEYLGATQNGKYFRDLEPKYQQRIKRTQLAVNILDDRSPQEVIYDIFRRINTGGMPLTPQEMRNSICSETVRSFLINGAGCEEFKQATRNKIKDLRMDAQEMFLRFVTLYRKYNYSSHQLEKLQPSKLIYLMNKEMAEIEKLDNEGRKEILKSFRVSMTRCFDLFGDFAFSKIKLDESGETIIRPKDLINRSLFVAFSLLLADPCFKNSDLKKHREDALRIIAKALADPEYDRSISNATGDERTIKVYLKKSREVLEKCGLY